jgi:hypothetical protein
MEVSLPCVGEVGGQVDGDCAAEERGVCECHYRFFCCWAELILMQLGGEVGFVLLILHVVVVVYMVTLSKFS